VKPAWGAAGAAAAGRPRVDARAAADGGRREPADEGQAARWRGPSAAGMGGQGYARRRGPPGLTHYAQECQPDFS